MGKAPIVTAAASIAPSAYPATQARLDSAYYIDDTSDMEGSITMIMEHIQLAAQSLHATSILVRTRVGTIHPSNAAWQAIAGALTAVGAGYTVSTSPSNGDATISWD